MLLSSVLFLLGNTASPTATPQCWIYDKIQPAAGAAFQALPAAERIEIEKWAAPASPSQERLVRGHSPWAKAPSASEVGIVRWMGDLSDPSSLLVFVAQPVKMSGDGYFPWVALNTNAIINPNERGAR